MLSPEALTRDGSDPRWSLARSLVFIQRPDTGLELGSGDAAPSYKSCRSQLYPATFLAVSRVIGNFSDLGPRPVSISTPSTPRARVSQRSSRGTKSMSSDRLGKARGGGCIPACAGSAGFGVAAAGRIAPAAGGDGIADSATSR